MNVIIWILVFGIAGFATAGLLLHKSGGEGWELFRYFAGIASLLVSGLVWALLSRGRIPGLARGAGMGLLVGLLAHPVTWYLASMYNYVRMMQSHNGDEPLGPVTGVAGALVFSFWSLLFTGWITLPLAAGLGALAAWMMNRVS